MPAAPRSYAPKNVSTRRCDPLVLRRGAGEDLGCSVLRRQLQTLHEVLTAAPEQVVGRGEQRLHRLHRHTRRVGDVRPRRRLDALAGVELERARDDPLAGGVDLAGLAGLVARRCVEAASEASCQNSEAADRCGVGASSSARSPARGQLPEHLAADLAPSDEAALQQRRPVRLTWVSSISSRRRSSALPSCGEPSSSDRKSWACVPWATASRDGTRSRPQCAKAMAASSQPINS